MNTRILVGCAQLLLAGLTFSGAQACGSSDTFTEPPAVDSRQELRGPPGHRALAREYATFEQVPAGVAGNEDLVFVGNPLEGAVLVLDRFSGIELGTLPTPSEGFILPYIIRNLNDRRIGILDAGGLPSPLPFVPANPRIYEYEYRYEHDAKGAPQFSAKLVRTVSFSNELIGFAEDIAPIGHGRYVLSDAVIGSLWLVDSDGSVRRVVGSTSNDPAQGVFPLAYCPTMPEITVGGLPFLFSGSTLPGVAALTSKDDTLYFYSPCARGLYSIPISSLFDHRQPLERVKDVKLVSPASPSVAVEQLLGLAFDKYDPKDDFLYAADSLQLRIIRIDVSTGAREVVADDPRLFNFPSSGNFLPPVRGTSPLLVISNQQHRMTLTNDAITEDELQPPFLATEVVVKR